MSQSVVELQDRVSYLEDIVNMMSYSISRVIEMPDDLGAEKYDPKVNYKPRYSKHMESGT